MYTYLDSEEIFSYDNESVFGGEITANRWIGWIWFAVCSSEFVFSDVSVSLLGKLFNFTIKNSMYWVRVSRKCMFQFWNLHYAAVILFSRSIWMFWGCFDPKVIILWTAVNNVWGELTDTSAKTIPLVWRCWVQMCTCSFTSRMTAWTTRWLANPKKFICIIEKTHVQDKSIWKIELFLKKQNYSCTSWRRIGRFVIFRLVCSRTKLRLNAVETT